MHILTKNITHWSDLELRLTIQCTHVQQKSMLSFLVNFKPRTTCWAMAGAGDDGSRYFPFRRLSLGLKHVLVSLSGLRFLIFIIFAFLRLWFCRICCWQQATNYLRSARPVVFMALPPPPAPCGLADPPTTVRIQHQEELVTSEVALDSIMSCYKFVMRVPQNESGAGALDLSS